MKRFLCIAALFAIVMIPDWASACWARRGPIFYGRTYYAPRYYSPTYYSPPMVYRRPVYGQPVYVLPGYGYSYVQPHTPTPQPLYPPSIEQSQVSPPRMPSVAKPEPAPPSTDPIVPATQVEPAPKPKPIPVPAPTKNEPKGGGLSLIPMHTAPKPASPETPSPKPKAEPKVEEPTIPPLDNPRLPDPKPNLNANPPSIMLPGNEASLPPLTAPMEGKNNKNNESPKDPDPNPEPPKVAVPVPAPPEDSLIPPANIPEPKTPSLPPLTVPPDAPVIPDTQDKAKGTSESKSSPLTTAARALKVTVYPASGNAAGTDGLYKIGFFNHTKRDVVLTIEGKTVTLPAQSYLHANLPPTFTWKCTDKAAAKETVPSDASGLDVLIRE